MSRRSKLRRIALGSVGVSLVAGSIVAVSPAYACDITTHCYGIAGYSATGMQGVRTTITPLTGPIVTNADNFITDEAWLVSSDSKYWVEAGYMDNLASIDGVTSGPSEFWFDSRPGGGMHGHLLAANTTPGVKTFTISRVSSDSYSVSDGTATATSAANTMAPQHSEIGSETTTGLACSWANYSGMSYRAGSGWSGFPSAWTSVNAPQQQAWVSYPTIMGAGVKC